MENRFDQEMGCSMLKRRRYEDMGCASFGHGGLRNGEMAYLSDFFSQAFKKAAEEREKE